jgi:hypothetical protein
MMVNDPLWGPWTQGQGLYPARGNELKEEEPHDRASQQHRLLAAPWLYA